MALTKCPLCDANADLTADGKWAHCASCEYLQLSLSTSVLALDLLWIRFPPFSLSLVVPLLSHSCVAMHLFPLYAFPEDQRGTKQREHRKNIRTVNARDHAEVSC